MGAPTKILILGSGGREHAIADRCSRDAHQPKVYVMPGNPGMARQKGIEKIDGNPLEFESLLAKIQELSIGLVVVGPEAYLDAGVSDFLRENNISVVGTNKQGAKLESSKAFSKDFMAEFSIPTAKYKNFNKSEEAISAIHSGDFGSNPVVKASSLAGGKGVFVTKNLNEAEKAVNDIFHNDDFKVFSDEVVIEKNLQGRELSSFALFDGTDYVVLGHACDYKRLQDGDEGPNTGGMGTWTPEDFPRAAIKETINKEVFDKVALGLKNRGIDFKGILFAGLMIDGDDVNVIEFNVRLGDPETQVLLPLLDGNFSEVLLASAKGELNQCKETLTMNEELRAVHVVKVSKFYPSLDGTQMLLNQKIEFDKDPGLFDTSVRLFFAGVKSHSEEKDQLVNSGGRVLGITALASSVDEARDKAYQLINTINFEGQFYRNDIAKQSN
jgi:phosphoribosylamine--glycine ligase